MEKVKKFKMFILAIIGALCLTFPEAHNQSKDNHPCTMNFHDDKLINSKNCVSTNDKHLWCFGDSYQQWSINGSADPLALTICNWPNFSIDPQDIINKFPTIKKLVIANSNLTSLSNAFPRKAVHLEKIYITGTLLKEIATDTFRHLSALKVLDIRNNELTEIDPNVLVAPRLQHVHLAGNYWKCEDTTMLWILNMSRGSLAQKIADRDKLHCAHPFEGRPLVSVIEIIATLKEECKRTVCECKLVYVVGRVGKQTQRNLMAFVSTNCSYRGLTEMPEFIPTNTTTLHLHGNKISDLTPLVTNAVYKQVLDIYLDNNEIESINQLESSQWLENFRVLSFRGNKLNDLPTYAFEHVLLKSRSAVSLYLGNNPWTCDCLFTPGFQDLLIRYSNIVKDENDIKCHTAKNLENLNKPIRDLTRTEICLTGDETSWLHPLDVLNFFLGSFIIFIIGKLLYDYWSFKRTGRLPWLVTKIP